MTTEEFIQKTLEITDPKSEKTLKKEASQNIKQSDVYNCITDITKLSSEIVKYLRDGRNMSDLWRKTARVQWSIWKICAIYGVENDEMPKIKLSAWLKSSKDERYLMYGCVEQLNKLIEAIMRVSYDKTYLENMIRELYNSQQAVWIIQYVFEMSDENIRRAIQTEFETVPEKRRPIERKRQSVRTNNWYNIMVAQ